MIAFVVGVVVGVLLAVAVAVLWLSWYVGKVGDDL